MTNAFNADGCDANGFTKIIAKCTANVKETQTLWVSSYLSLLNKWNLLASSDDL